VIPDDIDDLRNIALDLEKQAHEHGWDQPPVAGVFFDIGLGYRTEPLPAFLPHFHPHPLTALRLITAALHEARDSRAGLAEEFDTETRSMLAGVWLIHETWMNTTPREERDGRRLADIPGSKEMRGVMLVDCGGHVVYARRVRGEEPDAELEVRGGGIVESLAGLLLEHCWGMPDGTYDKAALEKLVAGGADL